jgi:hypothetical protein
MMAFDRTPADPSLAPETVEALRAALAQSVHRGDHGDDLRDLLCSAAGEARSKGIPAERLLITLKDIWHSLPDVLSVTASDVQHALLQQLISRCIQEYYSK